MNELVYLKNDEAVCDSLQVAEKFGKEHKNVLQSIDNLIAENSAVKIMFKISSYKSGNGQSYRKFYMNRDGFSLLAMGFTGRERNVRRMSSGSVRKLRQVCIIPTKI